MFKTALVASAAAIALGSGAAIAGPYAEIETNSGFDNGEYGSTLIETHLGYEDKLGDDASWFIQAGPAFEVGTGEGEPTELSGKVGVKVDVTETVELFGELSAETTNGMDLGQTDYGIKLGTKILL